MIRSTTSEAEAPYPLPISSCGGEVSRLRDMHDGFGRYMKGLLSYAPLENPSRILELGSGTGAWAIEAATTFPSARVIAADMSPLPESLKLPPNLSFKQSNFLETLPFEPGSFDVVHMRWVLVHLPNPHSVIQQMIPLLSPGGWLLLEEANHTLQDENRPIGPGVKALYKAYHQHMTKQGVEPQIGGQIKDILKSSGSFREVNEHIMHCYMNPQSTDNPDLKDLGEVIRHAAIGAYTGIIEKEGPASGITPAVLQGWIDDVMSSGHELRLDMHFTWSQKK